MSTYYSPTGYSDIVWTNWNTTTATTTDTWYDWNTNTITTDGTTIWVYWTAAQPVRETEEQKAARLQLEARQREEYQRRQAEIAKEQKESLDRAIKLLREHLSAAEANDLEKQGYIPVVTKKGNLYHIKKGRAGNVYRIDAKSKKELERLCIHPTENVPDEDTMLAQKLWLEWNEELFRKTANITNIAA